MMGGFWDSSMACPSASNDDLKVAKKSIVNDQKLKKFLQPKKWSTMTRSYVTVAVTTPKKRALPQV
jgi:hypothetical protein